MSLRRKLTRRTSKEWTARIALASFAAVLGYYSVTFSIAQAMLRRDPVLAYKFAPYVGRITAAYAASLAGVDAPAKDRAQADILAKRALQQDPTAVGAVSTLGVNAELRGEGAVARRYFTYARLLSRRDLRTQLWTIEDAVRRENIPEALHEYDITLRVFPNAGDILYPVLASANSDLAIRTELLKTLTHRPSWGESFITFIAEKGPDPRSTAILFLGLRPAGVAIAEAASARVINALLAAGQTDDAWSYYAAIRPGVDRRRSRDPRFEGALEAPSQLDWAPVNDGGLTASVQGGVVDFYAPASVGGTLLQQLQLLPPGIYRFVGHSRGIDQAQGTGLYWVLICQNGRELGRVEVPNSNAANGTFTGTFNVLAECPVQTLALTARPSEAASGLSGQFDRVELTRVGP